MGQDGPGHRAWWAAKRPARASEGGSLRPQLPWAMLGQHLRVTLAGDQGVEHVPGRLAQHVGGDRGELDAGVLEHLVQALDLLGPHPRLGLAIAGQVPQLPDGSRGHEARAHQAVLRQSASHSASAISVLRPGTFFTWRALTSHSSSKSSSSP